MWNVLCSVLYNVLWNVLYNVLCSVLYNVLCSVLYNVLWNVLYNALCSVLYNVLWNVLYNALCSVLYNVLWNVLYNALCSVLYNVLWNVLYNVLCSVLYNVQLYITPVVVIHVYSVCTLIYREVFLCAQARLQYCTVLYRCPGQTAVQYCMYVCKSVLYCTEQVPRPDCSTVLSIFTVLYCTVVVVVYFLQTSVSKITK